MEKIDILLATYNGKNYLKELLDSILNQTYENIRIIACDDCSTDDTMSILKDYEKKDSRVIAYKNEKNLGSTKTFEYLLTKVESKYFMFADQDDVWNKDKVELTYNKLIDENADLVFTDLEVVDVNLNTINKSFNKLKGYDYKIKKYINDGYELGRLYNTVTGCTILTKKEWIDKVTPFPNNKNILHDYWIGLVVSLKGKIAYLDVSTIKYRQHQNNQVGTSKYIDKFKDFNTVRNYLIDLRVQNLNTFLSYDNIFTKEQTEFNKKALQYYLMIKNKKYCNFKDLNIFNKIYKNEKLSFYLGFFFLLNFPIIIKPLYKLRSILKK